MAKPGRPKTNFDMMSARFPQGTFQRIDGVLQSGENRSDFLRNAVEREVSRRDEALASDAPMPGT